MTGAAQGQRRLGILVSHPIQYYVPWFRHLAARMDVEVLYAQRQGPGGQADAGFGLAFEWDVPLFDGYPHRWLANVARHPSVSGFWGCDTPELYDLVPARRYDAFLMFGWNRKSFVQAIRACWRAGVPVLMRGDSHLDTPRSLLKRGAKYFPYRWFLPRLDGHLYVGARNRTYLRYYGVPEERLFFAPHFVDNDFFAPRAEAARRDGGAAAVRAAFGIPPQAFVVAYVGKMTAVKRPGDVVSAVGALRERPGAANLHALLVGDGPLRGELEARAAAAGDRIHFAGFRNQSELPGLYAASDLLVVPGCETWGLVVNEAAACGLPAVVSDGAGCAPDLVVEGCTGYVYRVGDVQALADAILAARAMCLSGPAAVRAAVADRIGRYSIASATRGLEAALERVAQLRARGANPRRGTE